MTTETVRVDWIRDEIFLLRDHLGFPILMTQPQGVKGSDLLPLSIIGCTIWDVVAILRKQRQQITGVEATAESTQDAEPPWRFRKIVIRYQISGRGLSEEAVRRAIALSEDKYCSTLATLRAAVDISTEVEIVDELAVEGTDG
jgi:putative redox protein